MLLRNSCWLIVMLFKNDGVLSNDLVLIRELWGLQCVLLLCNRFNSTVVAVFNSVLCPVFVFY